mgnify:CR=1 FL=1
MTTTHYVDSSVILRVVLRQPDALEEWPRIESAVASGLVEAECLRTLDRLRLARGLPDGEIAVRREAVIDILDSFTLVEPTWPVIRRASQPMPTSLGTLDAIHLATALLWQEQEGTRITMATHDSALALAARAQGMRVTGQG